MEKRTEKIYMKVLPSVKAMAAERAAEEGRTLSNYIENLIKKGGSTLEVLKEDLVLRKEGIYWTLYLGDYQCGCGFLEDMTELLEEVGKRLAAGESVGEIAADFEPR